MALLDRVKERTKSDLSDEELQRLIDEAEGEITRRFGVLSVTSEESSPTADPISVTLRGGSSNLFPSHAVGDELEIVETEAGVETTLVETDYRVWNGGRRIERLATGTNQRSSWAELVTVTYFPVDTQKQRDEVTIKLVKLSIDYEGGVSREGIDGYSATFSDYTKERESLLASLAPSAVRMA